MMFWASGPAVSTDLMSSAVTAAAGKDCNAGEQLGTHVLAMGTPLGCDVRPRTSCLPPHHCAAHPELFSFVDVDVRGP